MNENQPIYKNYTFEKAADELSNALNEDAASVRDSIMDIARIVESGTHDMLHRVAISDEAATPDDYDEEQIPQSSLVNNAPTPYNYEQQIPDEQTIEPIMTRLQKLRA